LQVTFLPPAPQYCGATGRVVGYELYECLSPFLREELPKKNPSPTGKLSPRPVGLRGGVVGG